MLIIVISKGISGFKYGEQWTWNPQTLIHPLAQNIQWGFSRKSDRKSVRQKDSGKINLL